MKKEKMIPRAEAEQQFKEMARKELEKYFNKISRHIDKLLSRIHDKISDNNQSIDFLLEQLNGEPENSHPIIYALADEIEGRKFLKWALRENSKRNQALIDKITEIEKTYKLPLEHTD